MKLAGGGATVERKFVKPGPREEVTGSVKKQKEMVGAGRGGRGAEIKEKKSAEGGQTSKTSAQSGTSRGKGTIVFTVGGLMC